MLENITFIFENCESFKLLYPDIFYLHTGSIQESIISDSSGIELYCTIPGFTVGIVQYPKLYDTYTNLCVNRLAIGDITHIKLELTENIKKDVQVDWPNEYKPFTKSEGQKLINTPKGNYLFTSETCNYKSNVTPEYIDKLYSIIDERRDCAN